MSLSMASRILSGQRTIRDHHTDAVLQVSQRLSYEPDRIARSLRSRASGTIAMVVPGVTNPFFPSLIEAAARASAAGDRMLLLADSCGDADLEASLVRALLERRVDGLLIVPVGNASAPTVAHAARRTPTVQLDRPVDAQTHAVRTDNARGMHLAVEHLAAVGRQRLALVSGDTSTSTGRQRLRGYREAVERTGVSGGQQVRLGAFARAHGYTEAGLLLDTAQPPEAIVCGADVIALGVLQAAHERGLRIPDDLAVTGFDDIEVAAVAFPPLTTVRQPARAMTEAAIELLEQSTATRREVVLAPELVVRASTPTPAADDKGPS